MISSHPFDRIAALRARTRMPAAARGFTLLELMIALVVVAILATIAYPTYTEFVQRSRIVDATSQLNDLRVRMEQSFQDNRRYDTAGACTVGNPPYDATRDNFQFACVFTPGLMGGYTWSATGNAGKGMGGFAYSLSVHEDTGALTRTTVAVPASWAGPPAPNTCWQVRKGGKCS